MAIVRRILEIMTMRVMVIIKRMADRFVENCPGNLDITQGGVVNTGTVGSKPQQCSATCLGHIKDDRPFL